MEPSRIGLRPTILKLVIGSNVTLILENLLIKNKITNPSKGLERRTKNENAK